MQITTEVAELGERDTIGNRKFHLVRLAALNFDNPGLRSELESFGNLDARVTRRHGNFDSAGGIKESAKIAIRGFAPAISPSPFLRPLACEGVLGEIIGRRLIKISIRPNNAYAAGCGQASRGVPNYDLKKTAPLRIHPSGLSLVRKPWRREEERFTFGLLG